MNHAAGPGWGFGLGMDLAWDDPRILNPHDGRPAPAFKNFLARFESQFQYFFFSLQPRDFQLLTHPQSLNRYFDLFDEVRSLLPASKPLALHHTFLNMGAVERDYPRDAICDLTNRLIECYKFSWINEDLGIWSLNKKSLAYPLPPILTDAGLRAAIESVQFYKAHLKAPLFVEFPGFGEGASFTVGRMDAFEFFARTIRETGADCVLDTGHILSYRWLKGRRDLKGLKNLLPLEQCREIHLSGCSVIEDRFLDFHHGVLLDEQLDLLEDLLPLCPNLIGITYEDPKYDDEGQLIPKSIRNFERLRVRVEDWKRSVEPRSDGCLAI